MCIHWKSDIVLVQRVSVTAVNYDDYFNIKTLTRQVVYNNFWKYFENAVDRHRSLDAYFESFAYHRETRRAPTRTLSRLRSLLRKKKRNTFRTTRIFCRKYNCFGTTRGTVSVIVRNYTWVFGIHV